MSKQLATEGTHLRYVQDLVATTYEALHNGTHEMVESCLHNLLEYAENDIRIMGGDLPRDPSCPEIWDEDDE